MSFLPLGYGTADKPGRDYLARLNGGRKLPPANPRLAQMRLFVEFWGPDGICPVQLEGILPNGEFVYFRARGNKVELEVSSEYQGEPHAHYLKLLDTNHELGTGALPDEVCVAFIARWIADYSSRLPGIHQPFSGEPFNVSEAEESIVI